MRLGGLGADGDTPITSEELRALAEPEISRRSEWEQSQLAVVWEGEAVLDSFCTHWF